jgi:hypothetical protein
MSGHGRTYLEASAAIPRAKAHVNGALAQLTAAGYEVQTATASPDPATNAQDDDEQSDDSSDDGPEA